MARRAENDQAIYIISVAAELAGVHPQTLRVYERKGLVTPQRTQGNTRRYSERDIELLRRIQELTQEGINLAGVVRILELEAEIERLRARHARTTRQLEELEQQITEALGAREHMALVPFKDVRRIRRAMKSDDLEQVGKRRVFPAGPVVR
ncbi:MAG: helix-turn-helix transcriptional regulator [Actinomycetota bacterium]|nr:helix-turn-helix transcriptional regulator [Actinomycetota bacterium]